MAETIDDTPIRGADMYGNRIHPIGETGYGASISFYGNYGEPLMPMLTLFHISDGFRQSLFSFTPLGDFKGGDRPSLSNIFYDRVSEVRVTEPHGRAPR